jgi:hypothetical protein
VRRQEVSAHSSPKLEEIMLEGITLLCWKNIPNIYFKTTPSKFISSSSGKKQRSLLSSRKSSKTSLTLNLTKRIDFLKSQIAGEAYWKNQEDSYRVLILESSMTNARQIGITLEKTNKTRTL